MYFVPSLGTILILLSGFICEQQKQVGIRVLVVVKPQAHLLLQLFGVGVLVFYILFQIF